DGGRRTIANLPAELPQYGRCLAAHPDGQSFLFPIVEPDRSELYVAEVPGRGGVGGRQEGGGRRQEPGEPPRGLVWEEPSGSVRWKGGLPGRFGGGIRGRLRSPS